MNKKIQKIFFVFQIIPSDFVVLYCLYQEENTCHRHSVLGNRFEILHITNRDFL